MGDGNPGWGEPLADQERELSLVAWRVDLLNGILLTSILALLPGAIIQLWQWRHDFFNPQSGLVLTIFGLGTLVVLSRWRGPYHVRAALLMALGSLLTPPALWTQGLSPGHFVAMCALSTVSVLLYSARAAFIVLGVSSVLIALTGYLFVSGILPPLPSSLLDHTNPLNWLRIGAFWLFPSVLTVVATNYLVQKLRHTLAARSALVRELQSEVAARERALAELARTQTQLLQAQKLEAIGQLAAGIAHDFNNTLAVVALEAEVIKRSEPGRELTTHAAEALLSAAERGKHLTQQLLLFNRAERTPRPVTACTQVFTEAVDALQRMLPTEVRFERSVASEPLCACIAPGELQHMVLNLGINARDAMPGGGNLKMSLQREELTETSAAALGLPRGAYAVLCCSDTGVGMDEATLRRLFEPFFTTKAPGRGTGLGLTNVWNIANRAGGTVRAESRAGGGATLRVYLPLTDAPPTSALAKPSFVQLHGDKTVLVVEDDLRVRALLASLLGDVGWKVLDAPNVEAALELERAYSGPIHLLCTDVAMPGRPARELIACLRERRPEIGVLVCSGYSEDEKISRGILVGELQHLAKPFTRQALLSAALAALRT